MKACDVKADVMGGGDSPPHQYSCLYGFSIGLPQQHNAAVVFEKAIFALSTPTPSGQRSQEPFIRRPYAIRCSDIDVMVYLSRSNAV